MRKTKILISLVLSALLAFSFSSCASQKTNTDDSNASSEAEKVLSVHFLEIGRASCRERV